MGIYDKEISSRINLFYRDIFAKYEKLTLENIENLRVLIDSIFSSLRPTEYKKENYRKQLEDYLYPDVSIVGLTKLYSKSKYIQYSFLMKVNDGIQSELDKNNKVKIKLK